MRKTCLRALALFLSLLVLPARAQLACGDCDLDGSAPTILDAREAARIQSGQASPLARQWLTCDVDASGTIDILDALLLAQSAVGLPVSLSCPARSIVFVLERSSSTAQATTGYPVAGTRAWDGERSWVEAAIRTLTPAQTFGVLTFGDTVEVWSPSLQPADPAGQAAALLWLGGQLPAGGSTLVPAAAEAFDIGGGPPDILVLLAAGPPAEGYSAVSAITADNAGRSAIDTIGFGPVPGAARQILEAIAGGGHTSYP
jgi:hypothetical protein